MLRDFAGYTIYSNSSCCYELNGKTVERTIRKAFPKDIESTLYIIKVKGVRGYQQLYADEMFK